MDLLRMNSAAKGGRESVSGDVILGSVVMRDTPRKLDTLAGMYLARAARPKAIRVADE